MEYQIIRANAKIGQIEVAYKDTNQNIVGIYAIDVPVVDGNFLTVDELHKEIIHRAPTGAVTREQEVKTATGFNQIMALVQPMNESDPVAEENARMWEQFAFEQRIATILVKFGVLQSDPTEIPTERL